MWALFCFDLSMDMTEEVIMESLSVNSFSDAAEVGAKLKVANAGHQSNVTETDKSQKEDKATKVEKSAEESLVQVKAEEVDTEELMSAIEVITSFMNHKSKNVNFAIDEGTEKLVIRVMDAKNNELIKQFPSEKILDMANKVKGLQQEIGEKTGILIDSKV